MPGEESVNLPSTFHEDIAGIMADETIPWAQLQGVVLVTGATGTLGSAIVHALHAAETAHGLSLEIIAQGRNRERGMELARQCGARFLACDLRRPFSIEGPVDYVFHCAGMTNSRDMVLAPADVAESSLLGTMSILNLCREKKVKSLVYLSSMEAYGQTDPSLSRVAEDTPGTINSTNVRSCYPLSKSMCENLCVCHHTQYGTPAKMARLAQTFGAGSFITDNRAAVQFCRNAYRGENITLRTAGASRGNYCYLSDAVRALLLLLLKGQDGEAYNVSNPSASVTILELARLIADEVCEGKIKVDRELPADGEPCGYAPDVTLWMAAEKLQGLGWYPQYALAEMARRTIAHWREIGE